MGLPEVGTVLVMEGGGVLYVVASDLEHEEVRAKFFRTIDEVGEFRHAVSLASLPEWHRLYCERCLKEKEKEKEKVVRTNLFKED